MKEELELIFPTEEYRNQVMEYLQEHIDNNELELNGDAGLDKLQDFDKWLKKVKEDLEEQQQDGKVPATLFLIVRKQDNKVVGMLQIRHKLNEYLLTRGGHIGYGIRPTQRRKGYMKEGLRLALEECKKLNIDKALVTCNKENIGSAKTIKANGGVLENEVEEDGKIVQRYWITI